MSGLAGRISRRDAPERPSTADADRLAALMRDCELAGIERRCFVLHLSALPLDLTRPHHIRLAADAMDPLYAADRALRFVLPNNDIAVVWRGAAEAALDSCVRAIGDLFADGEAFAPDPTLLWDLFELPADGDALHSLLEASLVAGEPAVPPAAPRDKLDGAALATLEAALAHADMARFARRRSICGLSPAGLFQAHWETRYLSVDEIAAELAPDHALEADPWLFRRLTQTLDRRLLALLASADELRGARPFGLDLNVASILGAEFLRFDAALPQELRGHVTLGLTPADILADLPAFLFARDYARSRGYRLQLAVTAPELLAVLPLDRLGFDLLELSWSPELPQFDAEALRREAPNLLLARADRNDAIAWGRARGITRFQGKAALPGRRVYLAGLARA